LIDTARVYRTSESVPGDLIAELGIREQLFLASKTDMLDVMMVHSLRNAGSEFAAMREWQQDGRI